MTKTTKALKMAIEHIENGGATTERKVVINALKEALESQEQEPVEYLGALKNDDGSVNLYYKTPQQPLSDDEIWAIEAKCLIGNPAEWEVEPKRFARAIEQSHGIGVKDDINQ